MRCKEGSLPGQGGARDSLSQRERAGERGFGVGRSAGRASNLVTPLPPTASRRAPPSPYGRGISTPVCARALPLPTPTNSTP
ncbi:hypothetical protein [Caulobacter segnis]|uniref:hypothetical protein n=1 Tax=Caulobacter segnis TaxID=88688 RepID=UPI0038572F82